MMRISYLINQYPKVSHSFIRREILALERQGFNVQRIALRGWNDVVVDEDDISEKALTHYVLEKGVLPLLRAAWYVFLSQPKRFLTTFSLISEMSKQTEKSLAFHLIYFLEACHIQVLLTQHQTEHIHAHFGTNPAEVAMYAGLLANVPYSFTVHGPEEFDKPQALHLTEKIQHAKFVVAISSFGRSQLWRWTNYADWGKVKVVHCGLEPDFYNVPKVNMPEKPRLVCVGRLCEQKGQLLLLQAAHQLKLKSIPFELVLAGDGEMRPEIESLIAQYSLQNEVKITGWISSHQVRDEILQSKALVLPSFAEGLPVVIMEAMALRRPVISTYVAGIAELVIPHLNGYLVPAGAVDELVVAMQNLLSSSNAELEQLGEAAYQRVIDRHAIDTEVQKLSHYFQELN